jgi:nicotinamidase-related amidase
MTYDRLTPDNAAILFVDHQTGLSNGVQDQSLPEYMNSVTALAKLARNYGLPAVITTSAEDGTNGPLLPVIRDHLPDAAMVRRPGEINAWSNEEFVAAVARTGRKKLIVAGVSTEVCVTFVALSAAAAGYEVHAVIDASGTWNTLVRDVAVARMTQGGVIPMTWVAVGAELLGDWRSPYAEGHGKIMSEHLPFRANLVASYDAAKGK